MLFSFWSPSDYYDAINSALYTQLYSMVVVVVVPSLLYIFVLVESTHTHTPRLLKNLALFLHYLIPLSCSFW